jgi:hypothetical protein
VKILMLLHQEERRLEAAFRLGILDRLFRHDVDRVVIDPVPIERAGRKQRAPDQMRDIAGGVLSYVGFAESPCDKTAI